MENSFRIMRYITFDLETLGNHPTAPIIQIAAVEFVIKENPNTLASTDATLEDILIDTYNAHVSPKSLERLGFAPEPSTVFWWMEQSDEARRLAFDKSQAQPLEAVLSGFFRWIGDPFKYLYWTHATFDPPIIDHALHKIHSRNRLPYTRQRDLRTLADTVGYDAHSIPRIGELHDAMGDALTQAMFINKAILDIRQHYPNAYKMIENGS